MADGHPVTPRWSTSRWLLLGLLLLAAGLRYWDLPEFPRGVEHDEVAEVLIAEGVLRGEHALYFEEAYGQEPLFLYLVAVSRALIGRNVLALRFVSASVGLLVVAAAARLGRRMFNERVGVVAAMGVGISLWPVFWSRVGLRAMLLPLTMCLGAEALWSVLQDRRSRAAPGTGARSAALAGLWFGLSAYTYLAARGVPLVLGGWLVLLMLFDGRCFRRHWREIALALVLAAAVAVPLVVHLVWHTPVQTRVAEVDAPLRALQNRNPGPVLANVPRILGMFLGTGDATARNNLPGRPVFAEPLWALFFVIGLLVALGRFVDPRHGLLWVWLVAMVSPSLVTIEAPNFVRTLGTLPATMLLLGVGADFVWGWLRRVKSWGPALSVLLLAASLGPNLILTVRDYFIRWPQSPEVAFVWQWDFAEIAAWLDAHPTVTDVTVGGLSNQSMDGPSLDLLMKREDAVVRWCDPGSPIGSAGAVLWPGAGGEILIPSFVPVNAVLADRLLSASEAVVRGAGGFDRYDVAPSVEPAQRLVVYEGGAVLVDAELPATRIQAGETLTFVSTWLAQGEAHPDLKAFLHVVDATGALRAQHDGLDCPAPFWRAGDVIVQVHRLELPADLPSGTYSVRIGLYDRQTLTPYTLLDGSPSYEAGTLEVGDV
ncbi:MAG: glycosyltransferase family 39 protein [Anaerolineae bacterium]|nr:glycosyltransferase family 39 protein [Anaerolineae bacterium]